MKTATVPALAGAGRERDKGDPPAGGRSQESYAAGVEVFGGVFGGDLQPETAR
jgi:hypothetical protein